MKLENARILLTGAAGGLGSELARQLTAAGSSLLLAGRNAKRLEALRETLGAKAAIVAADLTSTEGVAQTVRAAQAFNVNLLINNAGANSFGLLENQPWSSTAQVLAISLEAPIHLTQALLPWLKALPQAAIVNIGSTFGSLPFPGFVAYSAAKAGLHGFSQALRRELADSLVSVMYIAPRTIDTPMNKPAVNELNRALKNRGDSPEQVAGQIIQALRRNVREAHLGFPERFLAWLNGVAPSLIDLGLASKLPTIKQHASSRH